MSLAPGTRLGPYEIQAAVGSGGMGEVYRARDVRLDRQVAVKVLPGDLMASQQALERFEREAKAIAALSHPNICVIHDVGEAALPGDAAPDGRTVRFLVMELLEGETIHQALLRGPFSLTTLVDYGIALSDALDAAHARGLIHRDIKPANILVSARGPKILDFGLAKALAPPSSHDDDLGHPTRSTSAALTGVGTTVGTVAYMSPEQLLGQPLDARSDLFSLGLVLYEMATGRPAFAGPTSAALSAAILHDDVIPPRQLRPDLPPELDATIRKTLEKDRDVRCQTAAELRADLKRLRREVDAAHGSGSGKNTLASTATTIPTDTIANPKSSDAALAAALARRHRSGLIVAAVAIGLIALAGAYTVMRWSAGSRPSVTARPLTSIADLQVEPLTISGTAERPALSPDGKYVVYVEHTGNDYSLRVRQAATGSNVEIVPPQSGVIILGATVTPDGNFVDFVRSSGTVFEVWRVPFLGGAPRKMIDNVGSLVGWSPDGRSLAFVRPGSGETTLVAAASDGTAERILATRRPPHVFLQFRGAGLNVLPPFVPAWSPDGRVIALAGLAFSPSVTGQIVFVDVASGTERTVEVQPPVGTASLAWLDADTLVLSRSNQPGPPLQLWRLAYPGGALTRLTNDLNVYEGVSITADRNSVVTARSDWRVGIWLGDRAGATGSEVVAPVPEAQIGFSLVWSGSDLFYTHSSGGPPSISRVVPGRRTSEDITPRAMALVASRDSRTILFTDAGGQGFWKIDADGRNRSRLNIQGRGIGLTPDGRDVVFGGRSGNGFALQIAPLAGGPARTIVNLPVGQRGPGAGFGGQQPSLSHDGKSILFPSPDDEGRPALAICDLPTCATRRFLPPLILPRWLPDRRGIGHVDRETQSNIWIQPLDGKPARQLTHFDDGRTIIDFAWSYDGGRLAVARASSKSDIVLFKGLKRP